MKSVKFSWEVVLIFRDEFTKYQNMFPSCNHYISWVIIKKPRSKIHFQKSPFTLKALILLESKYWPEDNIYS
jgi:hypothetical protein